MADDRPPLPRSRPKRDSLRRANGAKVASKRRERSAMFKIKLTDFRCFADAPPVEIRPITFLVGENSAGKTTFMAATRLLFESFTRAPQNPFNRDPYFLGGFDQIAHYRGGSPGRAKSFALELTVLPVADVGTRARVRGPSVSTSHKFTFVKGATGTPQPELEEYQFSIPGMSVIVNLEKETLFSVIRDGHPVFKLKPEGGPPAVLIRKEISYLEYLFQSLSFGPENKEIVEHPELKDQIGHLAQTFMQSQRFVKKAVFASAPIRTEPLRTYTPSEIQASAEGAHVPLEMARQKIGSPDEWNKVHERLAHFGENSGLFDDIDIRLLGKKDGDPFQVMVRTKGPKMNIVDVGYGVSQALPIPRLKTEKKPSTVLVVTSPRAYS